MSSMLKPTYQILVIGAGGTGGYFIKEFSRFIGNKRLSSLKSMNMADGDVVEEHNLERQSFISADIGRKKASVLTEVINASLGTSWKCFPQYILKVSDLENILDEGAIPVIIGCVDNHGCRLLCEEYFNSVDNCIYIDSANEIESGEVVFSAKIGGKKLAPLRSEIFPDLKKGDVRNVDEMSCEELNIHMPQHICTNMLAGNIILSAVTKLLEGNELSCGMCAFNAHSMSMQYIDMTSKEVVKKAS